MEDLCALQRGLHEALLDASGKTAELSQDPVDLGSLKDLKSAIDQMRHFLWFYIQAQSNPGASGERKMIELLRQASRPADPTADPDDSFMEQLSSATEYAILHCPIPPDRKPN